MLLMVLECILNEANYGSPLEKVGVNLFSCY